MIEDLPKAIKDVLRAEGLTPGGWVRLRRAWDQWARESTNLALQARSLLTQLERATPHEPHAKGWLTVKEAEQEAVLFAVRKFSDEPLAKIAKRLGVRVSRVHAVLKNTRSFAAVLAARRAEELLVKQRSKKNET